MPFIPFVALVAQAAASGLPASPGSLGGTEGPDLTRYLLVCSALLGGVALLAWGFRRVVGRNLSAKAAKRSLQVMDVLPMGGRHRLAVVRCYDRTFLLGMGEKEVSLVAELDPVIAPTGEALPARADRQAFADLLDRAGDAAPELPTPDRVLAPRRAVRPPARREAGRETGWIG